MEPAINPDIRPEATPLPGLRGKLTIPVLAFGGILMAVMQTVVVPLLPDLPRLTGASPGAVSWTVTATLLMRRRPHPRARQSGRHVRQAARPAARAGPDDRRVGAVRAHLRHPRPDRGPRAPGRGRRGRPALHQHPARRTPAPPHGIRGRPHELDRGDRRRARPAARRPDRAVRQLARHVLGDQRPRRARPRPRLLGRARVARARTGPVRHTRRGRDHAAAWSACCSPCRRAASGAGAAHAWSACSPEPS